MTGAFAINMASEVVSVGKGFTLSFELKNGRMSCHWSPRAPEGRTARQLLPAYRFARDEFVRRLSERAGVTIGVIEL